MPSIFLNYYPKIVNLGPWSFNDLTQAIVFKNQGARNPRARVPQIGVIKQAHQAQKRHLLGMLAHISQFDQLGHMDPIYRNISINAGNANNPSR